MKRYNTQEEADKDIVNGVLKVNDDVTFNFDFISDCNINAGNIDADNINAHNINAHNINAHNINAHNIDADNINAHNIDADNIDAHNIDADNIDAHNINYFAFCIAHFSLTCESIKGRRNKAIHKCLDSEIVIKPKKHTIYIDGKEIEISKESFNQLKKSLGVES